MSSNSANQHPLCLGRTKLSQFTDQRKAPKSFDLDDDTTEQTGRKTDVH